MDQWTWVIQTQKDLIERGQFRLAELMELIPELGSNDQHEEVDALYPEAVALARSIKQPFIEIYIRHMELQDRVLNRYHGRIALRDVIELVEFSHREEHQGCPFRLEVLDDLIGCYAIVDGPGYAQNRRAVAEEALSQLQPKNSLFDRMSSNYAYALHDEEKHQEALLYIENQMGLIIKKTGIFSTTFELERAKVRILIALGQYEKALDLIEKISPLATWADARVILTLYQCMAYAYLGRFEEAQKSLPFFEQIEKTACFYRRWAQTMFLLVKGGAVENNQELYEIFDGFSVRLFQQGAMSVALHIAFLQIQLASLQKNTFHVNELALRINAWIPTLYDPRWAEQKWHQFKKSL